MALALGELGLGGGLFFLGLALAQLAHLLGDGDLLHLLDLGGALGLFLLLPLHRDVLQDDGVGDGLAAGRAEDVVGAQLLKGRLGELGDGHALQREAVAAEILDERVGHALGEVLALEVQREEVVLRGDRRAARRRAWARGAALRLVADAVRRGVALLDADGARGLLDVVLVGLDADVELGGQVGRDEVLGHEGVVADAADREADRRQRHGRGAVQHRHHPAGAADETVGLRSADADQRLRRRRPAQEARHGREEDEEEQATIAPTNTTATLPHPHR
jgi:hypothetical protein